MTLYIIIAFIAILIGMAISVYAFGTGSKRKKIFQDIYFTVEADHDNAWEEQAQNEVLNSLTGDAENGLVFTPAEDNSSLSADVVNQSGVELPETGGIGTTLFYTFGAILVMGAAVLLVTKKRMSIAE